VGGRKNHSRLSVKKAKEIGEDGIFSSQGTVRGGVPYSTRRGGGLAAHTQKVTLKGSPGAAAMAPWKPFERDGGFAKPKGTVIIFGRG